MIIRNVAAVRHVAANGFAHGGSCIKELIYVQLRPLPPRIMLA